MKHCWKRVLAVVLALAMAVPSNVLADSRTKGADSGTQTEAAAVPGKTSEAEPSEKGDASKSDDKDPLPSDPEEKGFGDPATVEYEEGGTESFATLQAAIEAAGTEIDGHRLSSKITMVKDVDLSESVVVPSGKTIELNLNGKTIACAGDTALIIKGNAEIKDTSGGGKLSGGYNGIAVDGGALTFTSGVVESQEFAVLFLKGSTAVINGGTFTAKDNAVLGTNGTTGWGGNTITVNDGTFNGTIQTAGYVACGIYAPNDDVWNVNGGTFNITGGAGIVARAGTVNVTGGVFNTTGNAVGKVGDSRVVVPCAALVFDSEAEYPALTGSSVINVSGGSFTSEVDPVQTVPAKDGRISISGGTYSGKPDDVFFADGYKASGDAAPYGVTTASYVAQIGEGGDRVRYESLAEAYAAVQPGEILGILVAGDYSLPSPLKNITLQGNVEGVVFNHTSGGNIASIPDGITFKNLTFNFGNENYHGFQHAGIINMVNCTINGKLFSYGDMSFTGCTFNAPGSEASGISDKDYSMWAYSGSLSYTDCIFNGAGKFINVYNESGATRYVITASGCTFNSSVSNKAAFNVKETCGTKTLQYTVNLNNNTINGNFPAASETGSLTVISGLVQVDDRVSGGTMDGGEIVVNVDGAQVYVTPRIPRVAAIGDVEYTSLQAAIDAAQTGDTIIIYPGTVEMPATAVIPAGVTLKGQGADATTVKITTTDGNGVKLTNPNITIRDLKIDGSAITSGGYKTLVNVRADGCVIDGVVMRGGGTSTWNSSILVETLPATATFTVKNSDITGAFRGVLRESCNANLVIESTVIDAVYPFNIDGGNGGTVTVSDSTLHGWTSYSGVEKVTFTNCQFSMGNSGYDCVVAYADTEFNGCTFDSDFYVRARGNLDFNFWFNNCTKAGEAVTREQFMAQFPEYPDVWEKCNTYVNGELVGAVAKIVTGDQTVEYKTLQAALDAAHEMTGDVTVEIIANITGYAIVRQKAGLNLTIDGAGKTVDGQIIIDGDGRASGTETLTIQNIDFKSDKSSFYTGTDTFVLVPSLKTEGTPYYTNKNNYAHNITVSNCSFTSTSTAYDVVAFRTSSGGGSAYNVALENVTGTNLHSLAQLTGTTGGSFTNCNITASDSFVNISGGTGEFAFTGNTFVSSVEGGYGVRLKDSTTAVAVMGEGNNITADTALVLSKKETETNKGIFRVTDGIYKGALSKITTSADAKFEISGGHFSVEVPREFCATGYVPGNGMWAAETPATPNGVTIGVARIGETYYATLAEAVEIAQSGDTVVLVVDARMIEGIEVNKTVTIDLNGKTIDYGGIELFDVTANGDLTITGNGTVAGLEGAAAAAQDSKALITVDGGKLTIVNGTFTVGGVGADGMYGVYVLDNGTAIFGTAEGGPTITSWFAAIGTNNTTAPANITVNGGTYTANATPTNNEWWSYFCAPIYAAASGTYNINGGTFNGYYGISDRYANVEQTVQLGNVTINATSGTQVFVDDETGSEGITNRTIKSTSNELTVPEGYCWQKIGDNEYLLAVAVCKIGDMLYASLKDAVAAVPADGTATTIVMIADETIDVSGYAVTIPANKNVVLDLNGKTVVGACSVSGTSALIRNLGTLTIEDSSADASGKLIGGADPTWTWDGSDDYTGSYASNLIRNEGTLVVNGGTLYNASSGSAAYAIDNYSAGQVTINGGVIDAKNASAIRMFYCNGGAITVNGGTIGHYTSDEDYSYMGIQVMAGTNSDVVVNGGTIVGKYALYSSGTGDSSVSISGGTFDGYVGFSSDGPDNVEITDGLFLYWVGTWGDQTGFISGGTYAVKPDAEYIAPGKCAIKSGNYWIIGDAVAQIGTIGYATLAEAVADAVDGDVVELLMDASGAGIFLATADTKNITIELNNHTYTVTGPAVGSAGTVSQGFHLEQGNTVTIKNGTISSTADSGVLMLVQNYCDLTLDGVTLDGTNLPGSNRYVLSNNCGNVLIKDTTINAKNGDFAFDVCRYATYPSVSVTVEGNSVINGNIEISASGNDANEGFTLAINGGTYNGQIILDASAEAAMEAAPDKVSITKDNTVAVAAPAGYAWRDLGNGRSTIAKAVAKIGDALYASLQDALNAAHELTGEVTVTLLVDITEVAVIHQKAGLNLTVDGDGKTITGQLYVDGDGRYDDIDTLTIRNIRFAYDAATYDDAFIDVPNTKTTGKTYTTGKYNYAHNIAVKDCEFAGEGTTTVAFRVASGAGAHNVKLENLTVTGGHSFAQLVGVKDLTITGCTVTGVKNGINISGGDGTGTISGNTLTSAGYTVRIKDASGMDVTLSENTFSGDEGLVSEAESGGKLTVVSGKYAGPLPTNGDKFTVLGGVFTVAPLLAVCGDGLYPIANMDPETKDQYPYTVGVAVAVVDNIGYTTFADAVAASENGTKVITLLADIEEPYTLPSGSIQVAHNGKELTVKAPEGYALTVTVNGDVTTYTVADAVAKINDVLYPTLQAALDAAHEMTGDVTVTLLKDIAGYSIVHQKQGLNLTIDGADKKIDGQIVIDGDGRAAGTETLTIKNVKFEGDRTNFIPGTDAFILVPSTKDADKPYTTGKYNYAHNITITDCTMTSTSAAMDVVGYKATSGAGDYNVAFNNITGTNLHSLAQLTGTTGGSFTNCNITASDSFVNISGGSGEFTFTGNTFESAVSDGYGVRLKDNTGAVAIMGEGNSITASKPLVLGKNAEVGNKGTFIVTDGYYAGDISKITTSEDATFQISYGFFDREPDYHFIVEGKAAVQIGEHLWTIGDAVAKIGTRLFGTLEAAVAAAVNGDTIEILKDIEVTSWVEITKAIAIDLAGHTLSRNGNALLNPIGSGAALTLRDTVGGGKVVSGIPAYVEDGAAFVLESGTLECNLYYGIYAAGGSSVTINGGTVNSVGSMGIYAEVGSSVTINDGTVSATADGAYAIYILDTSSLTITGGTVSSTGSDAPAIGTSGNLGNNNNITISGGTITSAKDIAIYKPDGGKLTVSGGTVTGATAVYQKSGSVEISGGTLHATGAAADFLHNGNGAYATGDALVVETCDYPNGAPVTDISGGRFISDNAAAVASYAMEGYKPLTGFIHGGHFSDNSEKTNVGVPEDKILVQIPEGEEDAGMYELDDAVYVTFDADNKADDSDVTVVKIAKNTPVEKPADPIPETGFTFNGWFLADAAAAYDFTARVTENITLTAQWKTKVIYDVDGEQTELDAILHQMTPSVPDPVKDNYVFDGWLKQGAQVKGIDPTVEAANIIYVATWKGVLKQILYTDGLGSILERYEVEYGQPTPAFQGDLSTIIREGYEFDPNNAWIPEVEETVTHDVIYVINWTRIKVTVTFVENGGTDVPDQILDWGSKASRPTTVWEGHTFLGWYGPDNELFDFENTEIKADITITARWFENVARINDTYYPTLAEAIAAAQTGDTVILLKDVQEDELVVSKAITLDLDGHELSATKAGVLSVTADGDLTITGNGRITGPANGAAFDSNALIYVAGGKLTVENGTLTATGEGSDGMYGVYVLQNGTAIFGTADGNGPTITSHFAAIGTNNTTAPAAITVYGGEYTANAAPADDDWWSYFCAPVYAAAAGSFELKGGTFNGYYGISDRYANVDQDVMIWGDVVFNATSGIDVFVDEQTGSAGTADRSIKAEGNTRTLPEGYAWVETEEAGIYTIGEAVASITRDGKTTTYGTLAAAIAAAQDGDTVVLLKDVQEDELVVGKAITLDLNGKELSATKPDVITVTAAGDLTITGNGKVTGPADGAAFDGRVVISVDGGKLTIENGTVTATGSGSDGMYGVYVLNGGTAIFGTEDSNGPTITSHFAAIGTNNTTAPATITVYGGEYTANAIPGANDGWHYFCAPVYAASAGSFNLQGGTFNGYYGISDRYVNVDQDVMIGGNVVLNAASGIQVFADEKTGSAGTEDRHILAEGNERTVPEGYLWFATETEGIYELLKAVVVTFVTEDGITAPDPQTIGKGTTAEKPEDPVKEGYTFLGWFEENSETAFDFATPVTADLTLTARWQVNEYTITFLANEGDETPFAIVTANYGDPVAAPAENPTRDGYIFNGWNPDVPATMPAEDLTIIAKWIEAVAKINDTLYATLAEAIAAAQTGDTVVLLKDVQEDELVVGKAITLDLDGHELSATKPDVITVTADGDLTITGNGKITGPANGAAFDGRVLISVAGGKLTIENGTVTATGEGSDGMYGVYVLQGGTAIFGTEDGNGPTITSHFAAIGTNNTTAPATITVYGGEYTANVIPGANDGWYYFCAPVYAAAAGSFELKGGTFNGYYGISDRYVNVDQDVMIWGDVVFNAASGIDVFVDEQIGSAGTADRSIKAEGNTRTLPEGYAWVETEEAGIYTIGEAVASITRDGKTTTYGTLAAAIAAAQDGDTVVLLKDVQEDELVVNKAITLDLNENEVSSTKIGMITVTADGDLTITGNGKLTGPANGAAFDSKALIYVDGGKLTIENGTLTATGEGADGMYGVYVLNGGTAIFGTEDGNGPTITSHFAAIGTNNTTAPATITVYGGEYTANAAPASSDWWSYFCAPVYAASAGSFDLQGGKFNGYYGISDRYVNIDQDVMIGENVEFNASSGIQVFADEKTGSAGTEDRHILAEGNERTIPEGYLWVATETEGIYELLKAVVVTFVTEDGITAPDPQTIGKGTTAEKPEDPVKEGYTFLGWFEENSETAFDFTTPVVEDLTLTAKWGVNEYTITFLANEGDETPFATVTAAYGDPVEAPAENPTKPFFTFAGWNPEVPETMPAGDMTIVAKWTAVEGFYLIGSMTNWQVNEDYAFAVNSNESGEYCLATSLAENDQIKVVRAVGGVADNSNYYPSTEHNYNGMTGNYIVDSDHAGSVTVYFRPAGNPDSGWQPFGGYFYIAKDHLATVEVPEGHGTAFLVRDGSQAATVTAPRLMDIAIVYTPAEDYELDRIELWRANGEDGPELIETLSAESFQMPDYDVIVKVYFKALAWEFVDFTWTGDDENGYTAAVANYRCTTDTTKTRTVDADITIRTVESGCEIPGAIDYTAKVTAARSLDGEAHTDTKHVDLSAIGHDWEFTGFTWIQTETGYTAVANYKCKNNAAHTDTVSAVITSETDDPTCEAAGQTVYTATVTAAASLDGEAHTDTKTVVLPATGHDWEFVDFTWTETETGFTAVANYKCKNDETHTKTVNATVTSATTDATCEAAGQIVYTATVTAADSLDGKEHTDTKTVVLPAIGHDWEFVDFTWTETETGYTVVANYKCKNDATHTDTVSATVTSETTAPTCEAAGQTVYTATVTAADSLDGKEHTDTKTVVLPAIGHDWEFVDFTWTETETGFTAVANYKCKNDETHTKTVNAAVTSETTDATCEAAGQIIYTATVTAADSLDGKEHTDTKTVVLPAIGHDWEFVDFTWTETETGFTAVANYKCKNDETHTKTVAATVTSETTAPTCEAAGQTVYTATVTAADSLDGKEHTDTKTVVLPAIGHDWEFVDFTWTETETGFTAVANYKCKNDETHTKTVNAAVTSETTDATCEAAGQIVYTATVTAADSLDGKEHTDTKTVVLPAIGHDWEFVNFTWTETETGYTAVANYKCKNVETHTKTVTAAVTSETTAPTCEAAGQTVYTATVTAADSLDGKEHTDTKTVVLPAIGHDWEFVDFTWTETETGYTAVANYKCKNDATHTDTVSATVEAVTTAPTCEAAGQTVYTATVTAADSLDGKEHTDTKTVVLPATGHDWEFVDFTWTETETGYTAVANYKCKNNEEHTKTVNAVITSETDDATCEAAGQIVYTATVTAADSLDGKEHTETKTVVLPATGHDWEFVDFTWTGNDTDGYTAAVANYKCKNNEEHTKTVNAVITSETDDPTCEAAGQTVYTATVTAEASLDGKEHTETKTVVLPATGHDWEFVSFTWIETETGYTAVANYKCKNVESHIDTVDATVQAETTKPSCTEPGQTVYTATVTAAASLDGKEHTDTKTVTLPATGHAWFFVEFTWTATDTGYTVVGWYECSNNSAHHISLPATVTAETTPATCTEPDKTVYTATIEADVSLDGQLHTESVTVTGTALGHDWEFVDFTWTQTETGYTAAANYKCKNDASHTNTVDAAVEAEKTDPTCTEPGSIVYTATVAADASLDGEAHTDTKTVTLPATGHDWEFADFTWTETETGYTAVANYKCKNDATHTTTQPATSVTCEEDAGGNLTYTAIVSASDSPDGVEHSDTLFIERYTVTFQNEDGTVLQSSLVKKGEIPVYEGETPVKEEILFHMYVFSGWDPEITPVTGDATYTAQFEDLLYAKITGMTLALEGKIGINFWLKAPDEAAYAVINFMGDEVRFELTKADSPYWRASSEQYRLPYSNVAIKQMMDPATIRVYKADGEQLALVHNSLGLLEGASWSFRVADWAYAVLAQDNATEQSVHMAKALINLGNAAQNYFDYEDDDPANPNNYLHAETEAVEPDPALDPVIPADAASVLGYKYVKLNLEGDTEIRIFFDRQVTAKRGNKPLEVIKKGKEGWYVSVPAIAGVDLDVMHTIKVTYGGKTLTFKYSVLSFCNRVMASETSTDEFIYLAKALYIYNRAAEIYFNKVD